MSSDSGESPASAHHDSADEINIGSPAQASPPGQNGTEHEIVNAARGQEEDIEELASIASGVNDMTFATRRRSETEQEDDESASELPIRLSEQRPKSPESTSTPDDTPSIQGSLLSSPGSSLPASHSSLRPHRPTSLQPFERRFSARLSPSPLASPRAVSSPIFLSAHSRQSSVSSNLLFQPQVDDVDTPQAPWEVVRWTKLKKITGQVFSEVGKRNFGRPTCLAVAAALVIGTSKGFILVFDYQQVLKSIIGPGTKAIECGPVTALSISADHSTVGGGHATGHIFTWELARPAKPFLHIPPLDRNALDDRKSDGHISGVAILHIGFLGTRHTALVSADDGAQTQHKASRPKEIEPHSALSGCLAWFPAVKLKNPSKDLNKAVSRTKLVYCWSNILTVLEVDCIVAAPTEREKPTELAFRPRSRWKSEEAIVAVQWLSRSVLGVLTISQRLIILEDNTLRPTDTFDLLQKHIYHSDLFSRQLRPVIEHLDEADTSLHGVVADAFYMSFRAYKGRLFLLGVNDVSIGTLSNWADRLMALMEDGDFIAAIGLATSYYVGDADKLTVGLPDNNDARHALVQEKLLEMISASLKYTFTRDNQLSDSQEKGVRELAEVCFTGLVSMKELEFLFEDVYDAFEEASAENIFFETLEPYILDGEISDVPPNVLKDLITFYASAGRAARLEEMICRLSTDTIDINQVTTLCQQYNLYDALIHVWTQAIGDFITPLVNILSLIKIIDFGVDETENIYMTSAMKIFPYLAYTFTGRIYPGGAFLEDEQAYSAKKDMYRFLFSGKTLAWPPGSDDVVLTRTDKGPEPPFPYLRLVLEFDASSFMSMLNEAFEDSFLNGEQDAMNGNQVNGTKYGSALTPTRQYIVNILLGIMTTENFEPEDIVYFYMFVARNLPKYPQHIMLPGTSLHQILLGLCDYPTKIMQEDCQLSVEYLLSIYHPPNLQTLVPIFEKADFHRVLKTVYRGSQQYAKLLDAYLNDTEDDEAVFGCIGDILRPNKSLPKKQVNEVKTVIVSRARDFVTIDPSRAAMTLRQFVPDLLESVLETLEDGSDVQYQYLKTLIEPDPGNSESRSIGEDLPSGFIERYVQLMCKFNSTHVADFVSFLKSGDLKLDPVLPALEQSGVVDAAVILMARDGLVKDAMERLVRHLNTLETALTGLISAAAETPDVANTGEAVHDLLEDIQKYVKVGIWLCQGQTRSTERLTHSLIDRRRSAYGEVKEEDLGLDELLWLDLVDSIVRLIKNVSSATTDLQSALRLQNAQLEPIDNAKITTTLRSSVQQTFSALLASTTVPPKQIESTIQSQTSRPPLTSRRSQPQTNPSFLRILRAFLTRATSTSPSLSHLRSVLAEIFSAYTFEETILSLANRFLDKEGFENVREVNELRQRGWRPRGQVCEGCRKRTWGPGAGGAIWEAWERSENDRVLKRIESVAEEAGGKGKGKSARLDAEDIAERSGTGAIVIFACRHMWHRACLEKANMKDGESTDEVRRAGPRLKCPLCA
ncbi:Vacuolar protein sorting-associated protein 8 [Kalmusia sp. IMI 367209]|nr:Vacuolar protein sorting-associated protein 8 [Kalmusia sp. IMI 367209]